MKKYIIFLPLILMVFGYGCATSGDIDRVERQTAATNAQLRQIQGSMDDINFSLQAENKRSQESLELLKSQVKGGLKSLHEQTNTILRNQADLGNREFSSTSGGVSQGQIDDIRHELSKVDEKLDAMKALLMQKLAEAQAQGRRKATRRRLEPRAARRRLARPGQLLRTRTRCTIRPTWIIQTEIMRLR